MSRQGHLNTISVLTYFQNRASTYSALSASGAWGWQRRREFRALTMLAGPVKGCSVLDLGCGTGFYAKRLAALGASDVTALDISPAMVAHINDPRVETVVGDAATINLGRHYDLIVLAGLLEFVTDPLLVLKNARDHLLPNGRMVALVPSANLAGRMYRRFHRNHGVSVNLFKRQSFKAMVENAGLTLLASHAVFPLVEVYAMSGAL